MWGNINHLLVPSNVFNFSVFPIKKENSFFFLSILVPRGKIAQKAIGVRCSSKINYSTWFSFPFNKGIS